MNCLRCPLDGPGNQGQGALWDSRWCSARLRASGVLGPFRRYRRRIAGDEPFRWCRGGTGLGDCGARRARPSSCQVLVMVVDTSGLWPIPAVLLDTSCIPLVTSSSTGIGAGSLVTRTQPATRCPHGVCLKTTLVLVIGVDTNGLWPIPALSLDTSCIPLVTSLSAGIGGGSLVTSPFTGVDGGSLVTRTRPATRCRHGAEGSSQGLLEGALRIFGDTPIAPLGPAQGPSPTAKRRTRRGGCVPGRKP